VSQALADNSCITEVDLSGNALTDARVVAGLTNNRTVTRLNLSNNNLGGDFILALSRVVRAHPKLRYVDITDNPKLVGDALIPLRHLVPDTSSLLELKAGPSSELAAQQDRKHPLFFLQHFQVNSAPSIKHILAQVAANSPRVTEVDATEDPDITDVAVELLCDAARGNQHLQRLLLRGGHVTDRGVRALAAYIVRERSVTHLDLRDNLVTDDGADELAGVLLVSNALRYLNLQRNRLSAAGVARVSEACATNTSLLRCVVHDIDECADHLVEPFFGATDERTGRRRVRASGRADSPISASLPAAADLSRSVFLNTRTPALKRFLGLEDPTTVTELVLCDLGLKGMGDFVDGLEPQVAKTPAFDDAACVVLCDGLKSNRSLTILNIAGNRLTHTAAAAVADVLRANNTLRVLDMSRNCLSRASSMIVDAVAVNDSILHVDLQYNDTPQLSIQRLETLLQLNQEPKALKRLVVALQEEKQEPREVVLSCPRVPGFESAHGGLCRGDPGAIDVPGEWDESDYATKYWCTALARHALEQGWASVRKSQLDDESLVLLTSALSTNLSVAELRLAQNAITDRGVKRLVSFLSDGRSSITAVDLSHNLITSVGASALAQLAATLPLAHIDLSHNIIDETCLPSVQEALLNNGHLVRFDLSATRIPAEGIAVSTRLLDVNRLTVGDVRASLIGAFKNDPRATQVDLNAMLSMGMWRPELLHITAGLPAHSRFVTSISFEMNDITDSQFSKFVPCLERWHSLRTLNLGCNHLVNVEALCHALAAPTCGVTTLDVRGNRLNVTSAKAISELLRSSDTLTSLDVSNNKWTHVGVALILGALPMNDGLREIEVQGPGITPELVERCHNALTLHYKHIPLSGETSPRLPSSVLRQESTVAGTGTNAVRAVKKKTASFHTSAHDTLSATPPSLMPLADRNASSPPFVEIPLLQIPPW
jgi:Ran GTPase-activating protein (RanGAP) involved in mRNA processing and transport